MNPEDYQKYLDLFGSKSFQEVEILQRKKARIVALVLASATTISLIFLVFAFVLKQRGDALEKELLQTKAALEKCAAR
jgi:hypothetical protein